MPEATELDIEPLPASLGATVTGVRLTSLDDDQFRALYEAWLEYGLLIVPGQHLTKAEQTAFTRRFGPLEIELGTLSNLAEDGTVRSVEDDMIKVLKGSMAWHQDSTFMPVQAKGAVLSGVMVPDEGGETGFADMAAAYEALPQAKRDLVDGLCAYHSVVRSQARVGHVQKPGSAYNGYGMDVADPPLRPLVKVHPETGRKALSIGRHAYAIRGLSDEETEKLLAELRDAACQPPRVWKHRWTAGDVVIWDNLRVLHRVCPWDMRLPRLMWHTRMAGDPASESGMKAAH